MSTGEQPDEQKRRQIGGGVRVLARHKVRDWIRSAVNRHHCLIDRHYRVMFQLDLTLSLAASTDDNPAGRAFQVLL